MGLLGDIESFFGLTPATTPQRATRSTAPVPSAQHVGMLVAPSIPGHVIPVPNPTDNAAIDAASGGILSFISKQSQALQGQGVPVVDAEGYWRDFSTGALYQFKDPNTDTPIGRPGYMPNRYVQTYQMQQALAAADPASASAGTDPAAVAQAIGQGISTAATVAGAVAAGSDAAGTAAAVAGVAGSVLACLGPLPVERGEEWQEAKIQVRIVKAGARALALTVAPSSAGYAVTAVEVDRQTASMIESRELTVVECAVSSAYNDHGHALIGVFVSLAGARVSAERYGEAWRAHRSIEATGVSSMACECEEIGR